VAVARELRQSHDAYARAGRELAERARGILRTIPLNAAGVAILVYVVVRGRRFGPSLR